MFFLCSTKMVPGPLLFVRKLFSLIAALFEFHEKHDKKIREMNRPDLTRRGERCDNVSLSFINIEAWKKRLL